MGSLVLMMLIAGCSSPPTPDSPVDASIAHTDGWSRLPDGPLSARHGTVGAWLDQRFVLFGGWSQPPCPPNADCAWPTDAVLRDGASFDPAAGTWKLIAEAPMPVSGWNSAVVNDRWYFLTAGFPRTDSPVTFLSYDPAADDWTSLPVPRAAAGSRLVAAGDRVMAISSSDEQAKAIDSVFDSATGSWQQIPDDPLGPGFDRAAVWLGDALLLTAKDLVPGPGSAQPAVVRLATLDATLTEWAPLPDSEVIGGSPTAVGGRVVFPERGSADGGEVNNWGRPFPHGGVFNPSDSSWTPLPDPPAGAGLGWEALTVGGNALVGGHLLDPATSDWTVVPPPPGPERYSTTILANADTIVVWGGASADQNLADGYLLHY